MQRRLFRDGRRSYTCSYAKAKIQVATFESETQTLEAFRRLDKTAILIGENGRFTLKI